MGQLLLGLAVVVLASVLQGSFLVPMVYVRRWPWENSWAVFSILGMICFNWALALVTIPPLPAVYADASLPMVLIPLAFGLLWGLGAVGFGVGIAAVGLALGYAVIMGLVLSLGAFIPMAVLHPQEILTAKGITVMVGVAAMVFGIALFGQAGMRKEKEQGQRTGEITKLSTISMKLGLVICIFGGVFSCFPNVGFALSQPLTDLAVKHEAGPRWAGNAVWSILFSGGAAVNLAYCGYLFAKNGSLKDYRCPEAVWNLCLMALVSSMWIGSFCLYGVGARMMGDWGMVIGWSVFVALSVSIAGIWGVVQGEWAGTSPPTRTRMLLGIAILVLTIFILACGGML
jgi:L-rhamnose-H+ transport protein